MNPEVKVGQIWRSTDPRDRKWEGAIYQWRQVVVVGFGSYKRGDPSRYYHHTRVHTPWCAPDTHAVVQSVRTGRLSRVKFRRLRYRLGSRGYTLVKEVEPGPLND